MRRRLIIFLTLLSLVYFYLGISWMGALSLSGVAELVSWLLLAIPFLSMIWMLAVLWQRDDERQSVLDTVIQWTAFMSMGFLSFTLALTVVRDVLALVLSLVGHPEEFLHSPLSFVWLFGFAITLLVLGVISARFFLETSSVDIGLENLPKALEGFKIVQISDLHIGAMIRGGFIRKVVARVNSLQPDVIVLTGDIVDGYVEALKSEIAALGELKAKYGRYYITGNHEYYWTEQAGAQAVVNEFKRLGFSALVNESEVIEKDGARIVMAGVPDYMSTEPAPDPQKALEKNGSATAVKILLAHQPSFAKAASEAGYDLQLSGHTHGGQFFPWTLIIGWFHQFPRGLGRLGKMQIYVNRGTGYWGPPVRLGASAEISLIRLTALQPS
jgi:predicted MPP superfamily phosphohydrolase